MSSTGYDIVLRHDMPDGPMYTRYLHLDPSNKSFVNDFLTTGVQFVPQGSQMAIAGSSGMVPLHLHFDVQGSVSVNAGLDGRPALNMQGIRWYMGDLQMLTGYTAASTSWLACNGPVTKCSNGVNVELGG